MMTERDIQEERTMKTRDAFGLACDLVTVRSAVRRAATVLSIAPGTVWDLMTVPRDPDNYTQRQALYYVRDWSRSQYDAFSAMTRKYDAADLREYVTCPGDQAAAKSFYERIMQEEIMRHA